MGIEPEDNSCRTEITFPSLARSFRVWARSIRNGFIMSAISLVAVWSAIPFVNESSLGTLPRVAAQAGDHGEGSVGC